MEARKKKMERYRMYLHRSQAVEDHYFLQLCPKRRIGILGGTFNPVHAAHVDLARKANREFALDETLFIVAKNPPHKNPGEIIDAVHRYQMVCLAVEKEQAMFPSAVEMEREGITYTVDTLHQLRASYGNTEFYYIIGSDTLYCLHTWKDVEEVCKLCSFIVFFRPGDDMEKMLLYTQNMQKEYEANILFSEHEGLDVSSSDIRERVQAGKSITGLVPETVRDYIVANALYGYKPVMDEAQIMNELQKILSPHRLQHTIGVRDCAVALAGKYKADIEKTAIAALLHDCAKPYGKEESVNLAKQYGIVFDDCEKMEPKLMHAALGAVLAREVYGVTDEEILSAIKYHTTGRENMSLIEKIIYIADFIEPNRHFSGVEQLRVLTERDLDKGVEAGLKLSILHVGDDKLHPRTKNALQYYMGKNNKGEDNING
ncbi:MAG: nicotinate-nucleotide adenylyltransferase [Christensenellales bacterium]